MSEYILKAKYGRTDLDETRTVKIWFAQDDKKPILDILKTAANRAYAEISEDIDSGKWELYKMSVERIKKRHKEES